MSDDWYVLKGQKTLGPLTEVEVRHVLEKGRIDPETPIRRGPNGPWTPAAQALANNQAGPKPEPTGKRPSITVIAGVAAIVVVVAGSWIGFSRRHARVAVARQTAAPVAIEDEAAPAEVGHEDAPGIAEAPSREKAINATQIATAKPPVKPAPTREIPTVPRAVAPSADVHQSLTAARPLPPAPPATVHPMTPDNKAPVAHDRATPKNATAPHSTRPHSTAPHSTTPARTEVASIAAPLKGAQSPAKARGAASSPKLPTIKVAPVVLAKAPATKDDLAALESTALRSATAKDALAFYQLFQATRAIAPEAADLFRANRDVWEQRAGQDLVRLGGQWVAPADAAKARQDAAQLVQQAYELTKAMNFDEARRTLETASRVDPSSIAADFSVGILTSLAPAKFRSSLSASRHFAAVLARSPGYLPALNNLAIAEIREEKYAEAIEHLREAAEHTPVPEEVVQNLSRFLSETQISRIHPPQPALAAATELYARVAASKAGLASADRPKHGWRYLPLVLPTDEHDGLASLIAAESEPTAIVQGTGIVVAPHYLLTCRHVVDDWLLGRADRIEVVDPRDLRQERRLAAVCVAVDEADDLCLLKCDGLNVPPLALAESLPSRGTETLLLDLSEASASGAGWKVTQGLVTAVPGEVPRVAVPRGLDFSRLLWSDAVAGHRANGGALCDAHGNIIAIQATSFAPAADAQGHDDRHAKYAGGIPASLAQAFVRSSLPAYSHVSQGGPILSWSEVRGKVSPSLVSVVVGYRKVVMAMSKPDPLDLKQSLRQAEGLYDDHCCTVCNGRARVLCRAPGCKFAPLHDEHVPHDPNAPKPSLRHRCPTCLGTGYVRCPHCSIGIDPLLR